MKTYQIILVIVTTHNRPFYLEKIYKNYLFQKIANEILICDGGSKLMQVKVKKLINKYNFHNIKYFDVGINNHSKKRNKGIKSATGKYIVLLDDDCIPEKNL